MEPIQARAQFMRLKARRGAKKVIMAIAASMLTACYFMLRDDVPSKDLGAQHFDRHAPAMVPVMSDERPGGLLAWQHQHYPEFHGDRTNLVLHVLTVPVFQVGTLLLSAPLWGPWWLALVGLGAMAGAVATQGRGHAREKNPPVPFAGPLDIAGRIFFEQWLNFPRYVFSGGLGRAWRGS